VALLYTRHSSSCMAESGVLRRARHGNDAVVASFCSITALDPSQCPQHVGKWVRFTSGDACCSLANIAAICAAPPTARSANCTAAARDAFTGDDEALAFIKTCFTGSGQVSSVFDLPTASWSIPGAIPPALLVSHFAQALAHMSPPECQVYGRQWKTAGFGQPAAAYARAAP